MRPARFLRSVLRVPLAWKIAGANALLTIALAARFYLLPAALAGPATSSGLVIGSMLAAAIVNVGLISLALHPIRQLERTAEAIWSGATETRASRSPLSDRDVSRVAATINTLLEKLAAEKQRLQFLTGKLLEARTSERAAIAHELTESVAQSAAALALQCAALKSNGNGTHDENLDRIERVAVTLVDEVRRIARDVHPRHIEQLGLDAALRTLVRESARADQEVVFVRRGTRANAEGLPSAVATSLYDVAREALQNSRIHSAASLVTVSLGINAHAARLGISDNGCGFDPASVDLKSGVGLNLIRERVALVGGTLEIHSRPGMGTRIVAVAPLAPAVITPAAHADPSLVS